MGIKSWLNNLAGGGATAVPTPHAAPSATRAGQPVLIDVRSAGEFHGGAVDGAVNLPLDELAARITSLAQDPDTELQLYCASGARSGIGAQILGRLGYRRVVNLGGVRQAAAATGNRIVSR